ncbi:MAG: F0F1 ATP synthase subunit A [Gemmatimonadota bacterium]|nr:F0F1 ATP synthase subunit A [Gemmatimonadota bacterium]
MSPVIYNALVAPLKALWPAAQEHAEEAGAAAQEHGAEQAADAAAQGAEAAHEWGTETMIHHIVDSREWELEPFGTLHLPELPSFNVGGIEVDLSITKHVLFMMFATVLTVITMYVAARAARRLEQGEKAPRGILNTMEVFYLYLRDEVVMANIGHGGERFVPLVLTMFYFILYSNLLGLLPWGASATGNIMVTTALAVVAFVVVETAGYQALGPKGYMGTIFYLPPGLPTPLKPIMLAIMTPVELIGKLAKPFALAVRLFANMTAGHFVLLALLGLILTYGAATPIGIVAVAGSVLLGLFVMFLEIFVAFLQAYIFAMLTAVFIGMIRHAH